MGRLNEHNNFLYLTTSLLVLTIAPPLAGLLPPGFGHWVLKLGIIGTIVVAYLSLNFGPAWRKFSAGLLILLISSGVLQEQFYWELGRFLDLFIVLTFFIGAAYAAATRVLLKGDVDANKIVGALAVYLLLGMIWCIFYLITLEISPSAFNGIDFSSWEENFSDVTYFSFVTLTTLGYGDITPAEPFSRALVYLEAVVGVFYMAVVMASLVGARAGRWKQNN